ncbi:unnamed protein product [Arctogadus glacialis]
MGGDKVLWQPNSGDVGKSEGQNGSDGEEEGWDVPSSFTMLLGIIYCVNLEYPRAMKYSFEFLQRVVMKIKPDEASARVHGVRNKLLRYKL